jgi:hypothetical protein
VTSAAPPGRDTVGQVRMAPIFHILRIQQDLQFKDPTGKPVSMIDAGKLIAELG